MSETRYALRRGQQERVTSFVRSSEHGVEALLRGNAEWEELEQSPGIDVLLECGDYTPISRDQAMKWEAFLGMTANEYRVLQSERIDIMFASPMVQNAVTYASDAHRGQLRKGTDLPYVSHPIEVAKLVAAHGGTEAQVVAAICHDVAEDCGGQPRIDEIRARFGDHVADIVTACSDSLTRGPDSQDEWWARKRMFLNAMDTAPSDAILVLLADKVHNSSEIVRDYKALGEPLWERFGTGCTGQLWYIRNLGTTLRSRARDLDPELQEFSCRLLENSQTLHEQVRREVGRDAYQFRVDEGIDRAAHNVELEPSRSTDIGRSF